MPRATTKSHADRRAQMGTLPTAQELGAEHLAGLESYDAGRVTCWKAPLGAPVGHIAGQPYYAPKVAGYYSDGIVHFERGDGRGWDMVPATRITEAMMMGLPAEEQQRIRAHAIWFKGHTTNL